jgi:SAM-dependent methyltransferase
MAKDHRMRVGALDPYESALQHHSALSLSTEDGRIVPLDIHRYLAVADAGDETALVRCIGPVLDVGCGPGRMVSALAERGVPALGIDIAQVAVDLTLQRGGLAMSRNVFDRLPGEGRWSSILVLDGNIGIGGDIVGLLSRLHELLAPAGRLVVEASSQVVGTDEVLSARFSGADEVDSPTFRWAVASADVLVDRAESCGLYTADRWSYDARDFLLMRPIDGLTNS